MTVAEVLGVVGLVLSVALALGAALALVRGSYNKAKIQALREDNDDLRKKVADLDREVERRTLKTDTLSTRVDRVQSENELLREMVTQRAEVEKVEQALREQEIKTLKEISLHHAASMDAWGRISDALGLLIERGKGT